MNEISFGHFRRLKALRNKCDHTEHLGNIELDNVGKVRVCLCAELSHTLRTTFGITTQEFLDQQLQFNIEETNKPENAGQLNEMRLEIIKELKERFK